ARRRSPRRARGHEERTRARERSGRRSRRIARIATRGSRTRANGGCRARRHLRDRTGDGATWEMCSTGPDPDARFGRMDEPPRESTPPPMPDRPPAMPAGPPAGWGGGLSESRPPGPAAAAPTTDRTPALLTLIGGVLVVVGAFLP